MWTPRASEVQGAAAGHRTIPFVVLDQNAREFCSCSVILTAYKEPVRAVDP